MTWSVVVTQPADGAFLLDGDGVDVLARVEDATGRSFEGFRASLTTDGSTPPLVTGEAIGASGNLALLGVALREHGPHELTLSVQSPLGGVASTFVALVVNGPPDTPVVTLVPDGPYDTTSTVVASAVAVDPTPVPQGALSYTYVWRRPADGRELRQTTLPTSETVRGDVFELRVTASDGYTTSAAAVRHVSIGNAPPSCSSLALLPSAATTDRDIVCQCIG